MQNALHSNLVIFKLSAIHLDKFSDENFTFQSGYIQILLKGNLPSGVVFFTFQSGYIQMAHHCQKDMNFPSFTFQSGYIQIYVT